MYSVETLLNGPNGIKHQFNVLKHLGEKIHAENVDFRITDGSRSVMELLKYLSFSTPAQVDAMMKGSFDMATFMSLAEPRSDFTYDQFGAELDKTYAYIGQQLTSLTTEQWNETISVFNQTGPRNGFLVNYLLVFLGAYKTQLFLQLKAAGNKDLGTLNLWAGMDAPQKA